MTVKEYIQEARATKQVTEKWINGIKYYYITEPDGWISVINDRNAIDYIDSDMNTEDWENTEKSYTWNELIYTIEQMRFNNSEVI